MNVYDTPCEFDAWLDSCEVVFQGAHFTRMVIWSHRQSPDESLAELITALKSYQSRWGALPSKVLMGYKIHDCLEAYQKEKEQLCSRQSPQPFSSPQ